MSSTVNKYAVVEAETGRERVVYDNQAPATTLAKRSSWRGKLLVVERTYVLKEERTVRTVELGKVLKD